MIYKAILIGAYSAVAVFSFLATLFAIIIAVSTIYVLLSTIIDILKR